MPDSDKDLEIARINLEMEKLKLEAKANEDKMQLDAKAAEQTRRLTFYGTVFTAVMGVLTPVLLSRYHAETVNSVKQSKEDIKEDIKTQAGVLKEQASTAASNSLQAVEATRKLDEKADANLLQWKAFHSNEPNDMTKAAEVLAKVDKSDTP